MYLTQLVSYTQLVGLSAYVYTHLMGGVYLCVTGYGVVTLVYYAQLQVTPEAGIMTVSSQNGMEMLERRSFRMGTHWKRGIL